ncbi:hypothetical protein A9W98_01695 [Mycobacterium gordonae]|uniref:Cation/H+ exchanger transmembrane domain-containing protein n=1 Tax=Mycobacterium gordonae TaxID=1778 RepID=A0A1A6BGG7_MYCGO|nr:hypothetical protein A9W98_01695 [Mycobacterium gordonae]
MKIPVPLLVLVGAALAVHAVPAVQQPSERTVERVLTIALVLVLFDGGMHIGPARFRAAAGPILSVGVLGTACTARAAPTRTSRGTGIFTRSVSRFASTAINPTALENRTIRA